MLHFHANETLEFGRMGFFRGFLLRMIEVVGWADDMNAYNSILEKEKYVTCLRFFGMRSMCLLKQNRTFYSLRFMKHVSLEY